MKAAEVAIQLARHKREVRNRRNHDAKHIPTDIKIADIVFLWEGKGFKKGKLEPRWSGPWKVMKVSNDGINFNLENANGDTRQRTADFLMKNVEKFNLAEPSPVQGEDGEAEHEIEVQLVDDEKKMISDLEKLAIAKHSKSSEQKAEKKNEKKKLKIPPTKDMDVLPPKCVYTYDEIRVGDFFVAQLGKTRFLFQAYEKMPGGKQIAGQFFRSWDASDDITSRKYLQVIFDEELQLEQWGASAKSRARGKFTDNSSIME